MNEQKLNLAELLKDYPRGMELYSPIFGTVYFDGVRDTGRAVLIDVKTLDNTPHQFYADGRFNIYYTDSEMTLFPSKDVRTWEGFQRPFQDGDIVALGSAEGVQIFIFKEYIETGEDCVRCHMMLDDDGTVKIGCHNYFVERLATEEEKEKLFKAIKENGYSWNAETKTLEKLVEPKFKLGQNIRIKGESTTHIVTEVRENLYILDIKDISLSFENQDQWELVPNKFDITTLKPFDRVLVRDGAEHTWTTELFSHIQNKAFMFVCLTTDWGQCIPYEGNEHLLNTTQDCENFYVTWK